MKSVTEFANMTLDKGLKSKAALAGEGKSPEEIQQALGEAFKYEGDKLKHFVNALDVAGQNTQNLKRVVVVSLNEGESAPAKASKVDEFHYVPEFIVDGKHLAAQKGDSKGGRGGGKGRGRMGDGPKGSPWGLSPEQKAAKKSGAAATAAKPAKPS